MPPHGRLCLWPTHPTPAQALRRFTTSDAVGRPSAGLRQSSTTDLKPACCKASAPPPVASAASAVASSLFIAAACRRDVGTLGTRRCTPPLPHPPQDAARLSQAEGGRGGRRRSGRSGEHERVASTLRLDLLGVRIGGGAVDGHAANVEQRTSQRKHVSRGAVIRTTDRLAVAHARLPRQQQQSRSAAAHGRAIPECEGKESDGGRGGERKLAGAVTAC